MNPTNYPSTIYWKQDVASWLQILKQLDEDQDYDALGIVTIGKCTNLQSGEPPPVKLFQGANIPGLRCESLNVGKMLKTLSERGK